jgi:hypothetical protein
MWLLGKETGWAVSADIEVIDAVLTHISARQDTKSLHEDRNLLIALNHVAQLDTLPTPRTFLFQLSDELASAIAPDVIKRLQ